MSNTSNNQQNGRQHLLQSPPVTQRPLQDPRMANKNSLTLGTEDDICRDYLWGTCLKSSQCKYRHELDLDKMKKILRFCRDYQNRAGCNRQNCTYIHTTKEEQNQFMTTGRLPRIIMERHMFVASNAAETIPKIADFIRESYVNAPLPPPPPPGHSAPYLDNSPRPPSRDLMPPPPPPSQSATVPSAVPLVPSVVRPAMATPTPQAMPPLSLTPNPLTPMATTGVLPPATPEKYTGPLLNMMYPIDMPPPSLPPLFDATRPPPPLPGVHFQTKTSTAKRSLNLENETGPSKLRKEVLYLNCHPGHLRIDISEEEIEEETQKSIYQKKTEEKGLPEISQNFEELEESPENAQLRLTIAKLMGPAYHAHLKVMRELIK